MVFGVSVLLLAALMTGGITDGGATPVSRQTILNDLGRLESLLGIDPEGADTLALLSRINLQLGYSDRAVISLRRLLAVTEDSGRRGETLWLLAYALFLEEEHEEALGVLESLAAIEPRRPLLNALRGKILLSLGRHSEAILEFQKETEISSHSSAWTGLGIAAYRTGDDAMAREALLRAPGSGEARYHLGLVLLRNGSGEEAAREFRAALTIQPGNRGALLGLARALFEQGHESRSRLLFDRVASLYEQEERDKAIRIQIGDLAVSAEKAAGAGDYTEAIRLLEQAADLDPDSLPILIDLARFRFQSGDTEGSTVLFERVKQLAPLSPRPWYLLGRQQITHGDLDAALESFLTAARLAPAEIPYRLSLAQTYLRLNRVQDGTRELRLARRLNAADVRAQDHGERPPEQIEALRAAARELEETFDSGFDIPEGREILIEIYRNLGLSGAS